MPKVLLEVGGGKRRKETGGVREGMSVAWFGDFSLSWERLFSFEVM